MFVTSPWVPPEWIKAHGLNARGIWAQPALRELTPAAGVCAYAETVLRQAEEGKDSAFIFTTHCDQLRRSFDALALNAPGRIFLFNLPATYGTPATSALFQDELSRLSEWLVNLGGRVPNAESVASVLSSYQTARRRLLDAAVWCPAREYAEAVLKFHSEGCVDLPSRAEVHNASDRTKLVRLALVGGPFTPQFWPLFDIIEAAQGNVVLNATEAGERSLGLCPEQGDARSLPSLELEHLAKLFLNRVVDVFQRPNDRLYQWLSRRISERRVQALVLWQYFGCDLWRAELQTLQETFRLPVLLLEADQTDGGLGRIRTRLQAFLETLVRA